MAMEGQHSVSNLGDEASEDSADKSRGQSRLRKGQTGISERDKKKMAEKKKMVAKTARLNAQRIRRKLAAKKKRAAAWRGVRETARLNAKRSLRKLALAKRDKEARLAHRDKSSRTVDRMEKVSKILCRIR